MFKSEKYGYLLYNFLTNSFVELNEDSYEELKKIKKDPTAYDFDKNPGFKEKLQKAKILVETDLDEFYRMKLGKHLKRYERRGMALTIAPTRHCNLACTYCYEAERPAIYMDDATEQKLIEFIESYDEIKTLFVTWYGGEALMAFDRIVSLTEKFKKLDLNYSASLITNGYLLDEEKIKRLEDLHIRKVHITIDGLEEVHNQRRPHVEDPDSFQRILHNLDTLMSAPGTGKPREKLIEADKEKMKDNKGKDKKSKEWLIDVIIRVNVDRYNADNYPKLYRFLKKRYPNQSLTIYPGFVKESFAACKSTSHDLLDRQMQAEFNLKMFREENIKGTGFFPRLYTKECMARHINSYLVDPTGALYKCWSDIGVEEKAVGHLHKKGAFNENVLIRYLTGADPFDEPECQKCFYLPICEGRCPYHAVENKFGRSNVDICHITKGYLKEYLEAHYAIKSGELKDKLI